jgi:hypothetical protein
MREKIGQQVLGQTVVVRHRYSLLKGGALGRCPRWLLLFDTIQLDNHPDLLAVACQLTAHDRMEKGKKHKSASYFTSYLLS